MAIFSFGASIISRAKGYSTTAAAAYRARCRIVDERTAQVNDYSRKHGDLSWDGIFAPRDAPAWAHDRQQLWNAVERMEKRKDAQLARDFIIALPHELTPEQNRWLVQDFVREQFVRHGYVCDVAIHAPDAQGDQRNFHVHIMVTMRTLGADGFAATKDRTMNSKAYLQGLRESWEKLANRHLERHGHDARIDRRTLEAQGIDREPGLHMGKDATAAERNGRTTERGERQQAITTRNRTVEELTKELAELERQQGITEKFEAALAKAATEATRDSRTENLTGPAAHVWTAWQQSDNARAYAAALDDKGIAFAQVTKDEADRSYRQADFAQAVGNKAPRYKEAEIVIVTEPRPEYQPSLRYGSAGRRDGDITEARSRVHRLDQALATKFVAALDNGSRLQGIDASLRYATARQATRQASDQRAQQRAAQRSSDWQAIRIARATNIIRAPRTRPVNARVNLKPAAAILMAPLRALSLLAKPLEMLGNLFEPPVLTPQQIREGEIAARERQADVREQLDHAGTMARHAQEQQQDEQREAARQRERERNGGGRER